MILPVTLLVKQFIKICMILNGSFECGWFLCFNVWELLQAKEENHLVSLVGLFAERHYAVYHANQWRA